MGHLLVEGLVLLLLALINGVFAMSEIAVVSARPARMEQNARQGESGAAAALDLARSPGRFLSTVQVGITLIGVMAGAFGGATLGSRVGVMLSRVPALAPYSQSMGVAIVVVLTTYLSLILGELVPKRIALSDPERVAAAVARPMQRLAALARPIVRFLDASTNLLLRALRVNTGRREPVTEDEIKLLLRRGAEAGTFEHAESELVERVFRTGDRRLTSILTPRAEVVWLDLDAPQGENEARIMASRHARFPVCRGGLDNVEGVVRSKDLLAVSLSRGEFDIETVMQEPSFVPENMPALEVLETFKRTRLHFALVMDEYGGVEGLVTTNDILDALVGELPEAGESVSLQPLQRQDGTWLVDGGYPVEEFESLFGLQHLPQEERGIYDTVGGFVMYLLERIPREGDEIEWGDLKMEILDMDGLRVDKVLITDQRGG